VIISSAPQKLRLMLFRKANAILIALLVFTIARAQEQHHYHMQAATASSLTFSALSHH
jgi:hypothetical protein